MAILSKNKRLLTMDGKLINSSVSNDNNNSGNGINPSGILAITENGTYDVTQYAYASVNVSSNGGSGETTDVQLFTPTITATNTSVSIKDSLNGAFVESYVTEMNDKIIQDLPSTTVPISNYFDDSESYVTKTYAKGLLQNSSDSNSINHYRARFYNGDTLFETQIILEGNKASYPDNHPTKDGYSFLGYADSPTSEERVNLVMNSPRDFYAIFEQGVTDVISITGVNVNGTCCAALHNDNIFIFRSNSDQFQHNVLCYNTTTNSLITKNSALTNNVSKCVTIGDKIYITNSSSNKNIYVYDVAKDTVDTVTLSVSVIDLATDGINLYGLVFNTNKVVKYNFDINDFESLSIEINAKNKTPFFTNEGYLYYVAYYSNANGYFLCKCNLSTLETTRIIHFLDIHPVLYSSAYAIRNNFLYIFGGDDGLTQTTNISDAISSFDLIGEVSIPKNATLLQPDANIYAVADDDAIYVFDKTNILKYI